MDSNLFHHKVDSLGEKLWVNTISLWLSSGLFCLSQGLGTDEDTLIEILASRNNREILDIKKAYQEGSIQIVSINIQLVFVIYWDHEIIF